MADFDYSTLSPAQSTTALKVFKAAEKHGINPEFAVALAMAESGMVHGPSRRLNEKTKAPISYGVMQLTPALAAQYGIKDYQKASEDENIDVGMRYLKDLAKNPNIGDDPKKTVAGYNAGPGSAYVKSGEEKDLLPETKAHIENIGAFSPQGSLVSPLSTDANKDFFGTGKPQEPNDEQKQAFKDLTGEEWTPAEPPKAPEPTAFNPLPGMQMGALIGGSLSAAANTTGGVADLVKSLRSQNVPAADTEQGAWGRKTGYGIGKGSTQQQSSKFQRTIAKSDIPNRMDKLYGPRLPGESPELAQRLIDRGNALRNAPQPAAPSMVDSFFGTAPGRLVNTGLNAARGSLTGLGAYYGAQSAREAADQGNFGQAALHGVSGLSSAADLAASLAPTAAKTAVRGVTGPLAVVADTGANLLKHYPDPKEMALDVGTAGLAFVPGVGVPMALGAGYLRAHPEVLSSNVGNTAGATPGTDPMGGVYYETPDIPRTGPSTTPKSDALQQFLFNRKTKQSPNLNPPAGANLIPLGGMYSPGGMY
jgi:hypothetical protein